MTTRFSRGWFALAAAIAVPAFAQQPGVKVQVQQDQDKEGKIIVVTGEATTRPATTKPMFELSRTVRQSVNGDILFRAGVQLNALKMEKATYLGVAASPVPAVLREQMKLQRGVGLVADFVEPGSPAEAAGVQRFDLLLKLNDQMLIDAHQLTVLTRTFKPGEEVTLTIMRGGEQKNLKVKLIEKEQPITEENANPWGLPAEPVMIPTPFPLPAEGGFNIELNDGNMKLIWQDKDFTLSLNGDKDKFLTVKDRDGKVIFDGNVNTEEQRNKLLKEVRERLEQLEGMRIRAFEFGKATTRPFERIEREIRRINGDTKRTDPPVKQDK